MTGKVSEEQLYNYFYFTNLSVRKKVEDDFGIDIGELNFSTQRYFLDFLETRSVENVQELQKFVRKFGKNGMQTFLSCEFGLENGEKIIEMGNNENLSEEAAKAIFAKYGEIVENLEELNLFVGKHFKQETAISQEKLHSIAEDLMLKGKNFLFQFSENLKNGETTDFQEITILEKLKHFQTDIISFTSIFKNFSKNNPEASFEDFEGLSLETINGSDFKEEDNSKMVSIAQENYQQDPAMQKLVIESLQEGLQKENSQFFVLRLKGEIVAFDRFDDEGKYFYVGSFNVDADYRGSAIGEVMMQESFDRKAKEKPLQAITDPKKIICSKYVEGGKFIIDKVLRTPVDEKTVTEVSILRDDNINQIYEYRAGQGLMDLNLAYAQQQQESKDINKRLTEKLKNKGSFLLKFDKKTEMDKFENLAERLIEEYGYVITRYLPVDKNGEKMMVAFEQKLG